MKKVKFIICNLLLLICGLTFIGCSSTQDNSTPPRNVKNFISKMYRDRNDNDNYRYTITGAAGDVVVKLNGINDGRCEYVSLSIYGRTADETNGIYMTYDSIIYLHWKDSSNDIVYSKPGHVLGTLGQFSIGRETYNSGHLNYVHQVDTEEHTLGNKVSGDATDFVDEVYASYTTAAINWFVNMVYENTNVYYI